MRTIYLNKVSLDDHLPAINFTLGNAYGLAQAGVECYLIAQKSSPNFDGTILLDSYNLSPLDNLKLLIFEKKPFLKIKTNQWFYLKAFRKIKVIHQQKRIDAVISRDPGALPYMVRLNRKSGIPIYYQPHNFYVDLSIRPDVNPKNAKKYHLLEKRYIPKTSGLFCLQNSQAEWFRKYFPDQNVFIAKPGSLNIRSPANNRFGNRLIGYIGSLQQQKGVDALLDAFVMLRDEHYKLVFVGGRDDNEIDPIKRKITELGLENDVRITGWIPFSEVEKYLEKISVGILPLNDTFYNRYLTAPNKLFDYLSRGIPIVAADLPAIGDFIEDKTVGCLFKPGSTKDLARAISTTFADREVYNRISQNALLCARKYTWENCGKQIIESISR
jgi:glycosyltransferase involved in cell wall biosynthesis